MPRGCTRIVVQHVTVYLLLIIGAVFMLLPVVYMFSTSLKPLSQVFEVPLRWIPREIHLENYIKPFQERPFVRYFANSALVAGAVTVSNLILCTMAGYGLAKFSFPGRNGVFLYILSTMMLPLEVLVVPLFLIVKSLGWLNSYQGLIVPWAVSAFGVFLMRQFIMGLPADFIEAARVDGCGELSIFFRIVLPLCKPALAALAIFIGTANWDSFLWPLLVTKDDTFKTLPIGLAAFQSDYGTQYNELMAVALLVQVPIVVLFFLMQRHFIESQVLSGIKS